MGGDALRMGRWPLDATKTTRPTGPDCCRVSSGNARLGRAHLFTLIALGCDCGWVGGFSEEGSLGSGCAGVVYGSTATTQCYAHVTASRLCASAFLPVPLPQMPQTDRCVGHIFFIFCTHCTTVHFRSLPQLGLKGTCKTAKLARIIALQGLHNSSLLGRMPLSRLLAAWSGRRSKIPEADRPVVPHSPHSRQQMGVCARVCAQGNTGNTTYFAPCHSPDPQIRQTQPSLEKDIYMCIDASLPFHSYQLALRVPSATRKPRIYHARILPSTPPLAVPPLQPQRPQLEYPLERVPSTALY